jgi:hypothetical protein
MTSPKECAICKRPIIPDPCDPVVKQWVCERGHITQVGALVEYRDGTEEVIFERGATYYGPSLRRIRKAFKERKGDKNDNTT